MDSDAQELTSSLTTDLIPWLMLQASPVYLAWRIVAAIFRSWNWAIQYASANNPEIGPTLTQLPLPLTPQKAQTGIRDKYS